MKSKERKLPIKKITDARTANSFLLGVVFNQAQKSEKSWKAPELLFKRLGTDDPFELKEYPVGLIENTIAQRPALHCFAPTMAKYIVSAFNQLTDRYGGDARNIWVPPIPLSELMSRLTHFLGIGTHKASVAVFLLTVELGIPVIDDGTKVDITSACPNLSRIYAPIKNPVLISQV
jgi:endonuclease III